MLLRAVPIEILDAQNDRPAAFVGKKPGDEGSKDVACVHPTGRRWGKTTDERGPATTQFACKRGKTKISCMFGRLIGQVVAWVDEGKGRVRRLVGHLTFHIGMG